jgi:ATP-dependent DNA ligase
MREWRSPRRPLVLPAGFIHPCNPTVATKPPSGPQWIHEIKHDGYRVIVRKANKRVRIFTRRGFDWTEKFPIIVAAVRSLKVSSVTIDGEAVYCGDDGIADFAKLHSQAYNDQVFLYAFDLLEKNGGDYRDRPLDRRKATLQRLAARTDGMQFVEHLEGDGRIIFQHACKLKLEGIVSKRRDMPYRSGPTKSWLKVKNPEAPAVLRIKEDGVW